MPSIDDKTTDIDNTETPFQIETALADGLDETETPESTRLESSLSQSSSPIRQQTSIRSTGQYILLGIAALVIGGAIYQRYPRIIEDATVIAKGEDHVDLFRDNGTDYPEHYTELQPTISLNNYNVCLRGEGLEKLNVGDKLINVTYFLCPLTRCIVSNLNN